MEYIGYLITIVILSALNIIQFIYWFKVLSEMTAKLMSRNIHDYKQAINPATEMVKVKLEDDDVEEDEILHHLNGLIK